MELQFDPDHERRRALADDALALARAEGDIRILPYVLRDHFHATWADDTLAARERTVAEMLELAGRLDDPLARIWALDRSVHVAAESGRLRQALGVSTALLALTEELGQPRLRWHATYYAAGLALMAGDLDEAERLAEAGARLGEQAGEPDTLMIYFGQLATVRVERGRTGEVIDMLEQATESNPGIPSFAAGLSAALCNVGRESDAAERLELATAGGFADIAVNQTRSTALVMWARTAADVGSERAAGLLYDLIEPWRGGLVWNGATGYGASESYLGMLAATLGSHDRAREHFAAASKLHQQEGVRGWEALSLCHSARSLLAAGDAGEARTTAQRALDLARESHHETSARRAEALLQTAPTT